MEAIVSVPPHFHLLDNPVVSARYVGEIDDDEGKIPEEGRGGKFLCVIRRRKGDINEGRRPWVIKEVIIEVVGK